MTRPTDLLRLVLLCTVVVLGFALPRAMVWCSEPGHGARLEFAHPTDSCCGHGEAGHAATAQPQAPAGEGDVSHGDGACEHQPVRIELLPAPQPHGGKVPAPQLALGTLTPPRFAPAGTTTALRPPPATGPPRPVPRWRLRETTLLLL